MRRARIEAVFVSSKAQNILAEVGHGSISPSGVDRRSRRTLRHTPLPAEAADSRPTPDQSFENAVRFKSTDSLD